MKKNIIFFILLLIIWIGIFNFKTNNIPKYYTDFFSMSQEKKIFFDYWAYEKNPFLLFKQFIDLNKNLFWKEVYDYLINRYKKVQTNEVTFVWMLPIYKYFEWIKIFNNWNIQIFYRNWQSLSNKKIVLWFCPYHLQSTLFLKLINKINEKSWVEIILINSNLEQWKSKNFSELNTKIQDSVSLFLEKFKIKKVNVLLSSMWTPLWLVWINNNIDKVDKVFLHASLVNKNDNKRFWFLNLFNSKNDIWFFENKDLVLVNWVVPVDFFVSFYLYNIKKYNPQNISNNTIPKFSKLMYTTSINWNIFKEVWNFYENWEVKKLKNFNLINSKINCIFLYNKDQISQKSDVDVFLNNKSKIILKDQDHLWVLDDSLKFENDLVDCVLN